MVKVEKKEILTRTIEITWMVILEHGHSNGYVGVPEGHPWYDKDYDDIECIVHGGLTYGEQGKNTKNFKDFPDHYWVGFDTCHSGDTLHNWTLKAVEKEVEYLKEQAIDAEAKEEK